MKEEILNKEIKCLDHGFVRLVDFMGDDAAIVQAARVSYGKGTKQVSEDRSLIRYLMRNKHTSPFEMVEFKFHVKLPIFIARQWIRHRTANVNEYSGRYSEMKEECYIPEMTQIRKQSEINKQARSDEAFEENLANDILNKFEEFQKSQFIEYKELINTGLAKELARINLPLSTYTEWYWKIDLHNLFHFLRLRLDSHAQYEIQVYGQAIAEIIKDIVPIAFEAFEDYVINSVSFSKDEIKALTSMINIDEIKKSDLSALGRSEKSEFLNKLNLIEKIINKR